MDNIINKIRWFFVRLFCFHLWARNYGDFSAMCQIQKTLGFESYICKHCGKKVYSNSLL